MSSSLFLLFLFFFFFGVIECISGVTSTAYYTSSTSYSLRELTNRGLPAVTKVTPPGFTTFIANIDIPSREVLNLTIPHCYFKETMETWCCGENKSACPLNPFQNSRITPYSYCIVSEIVCVDFTYSLTHLLVAPTKRISLVR